MTQEYKTQRFIAKAKKVHEGENLDYSEIVYVDNRTPIKIIDHDLRPDGTEYGEYWQLPCNHIKGQGHPGKRGIKIAKAKSASQEDIIKRFKEVHKGENLDYSEVVYVNMHTKVKIISHDLRPDGTEYGEFWQEPIVHLKGCTHPEIGNLKRGRPVKSKVVVMSELDKSKFEGLKSDLYSHIKGLANVVRETEFGDFYSEEKSLAFNLYSLKAHNDRNYCLDLDKKAKEKGITLIHIFEDEYMDHKDIVLSKIRHMLGGDNNLPKIYGRQCDVLKIEDSDAVKEFLNTYHIQGAAGNTVAYGCFYGKELIGVMTFLEEKPGYWNLNRFTTNTNYVCPGVASKIFKQFIKDNNPTYIKSFLDRRWCGNEQENLYTKLGFVLDKVLAPDYRYTQGHGERQHKFGFRKQILNKKYGLPLSMTETEMTKELGYDRIWDCGLFKYVWTPENV